MIKVYKKNGISKDTEYIKYNDAFFNKCTSAMIDKRAESVIEHIDKSKLLDKYYISSRFDGSKLNIDKLSTGCKTALNIMYNHNKVFDVSECGENALEVIYGFADGNIYCDYPMIAFNMEKAAGIDADGTHIMEDYEELREWWKS